MKLCCIVVPIYREILDKYEEISLRQTIKIFGGKYPIVLLSPYSMKMDNYQPFFKDSAPPIFEFFEDYYFTNRYGYSRLMLKKQLYYRFIEYKYMLICQLDTFAFRDELEYWCKKEYDYIGAPWFISKEWGVQYLPYPEFGVGNGGFSLRNIKNTIRYLTAIKRVEYLDLFLSYNIKGKISQFFPLLKKGLFHDYEDALSIKEQGELEDQFLCLFSLTSIKNFEKKHGFFGRWISKIALYKYKIPQPEEAVPFSFEWHTQKLFEMNNKNVPFGCHAWQLNLDFWKPYIEEFGYKIDF